MYIFDWFWIDFGRVWESKLGPKSTKNRYKICFKFWYIFYCFGIDFSSILASILGPKLGSRNYKKLKKSIQEASKIHLHLDLVLWSIFDRFWSQLGPNLEAQTLQVEAKLASNGVILGVMLAYVEIFWDILRHLANKMPWETPRCSNICLCWNILRNLGASCQQEALRSWDLEILKASWRDTQTYTPML